MRLSYTGELGWELHVPAHAQRSVYDAVVAAGADDGLRDFGSYAMNSLRLEVVRTPRVYSYGAAAAPQSRVLAPAPNDGPRLLVLPLAPWLLARRRRVLPPARDTA